MDNSKSNPGFDTGKIKVIGHLLIRDKETKKVIINQREDAVHQPILGSEHARKLG